MSKKPKTKRLPISRRILRELPLEQLTELASFIQELLHEAMAIEKQHKLPREVIKEKSVDHKTYRLVSIRCGKENCKCAEGSGHGPYWYAYWSEQGKTKSQYIGKKLLGRRKIRSEDDV